MRSFALSAIGHDRPGIVAAVTRVLLDHGVNVEDSQATILRGHFTMMLIVAVPDETSSERLSAELDEVAEELGLEALSLREVAELHPAAPAQASHTVTVYGTDHPGIVHAATAALAEQGVNLTDLNTRVAGGDRGEPLYALMMEVALPPQVGADEVRGALGAVAEREGVDISVRELERDAL